MNDLKSIIDTGIVSGPGRRVIPPAAGAEHVHPRAAESAAGVDEEQRVRVAVLHVHGVFPGVFQRR